MAKPIGIVAMLILLLNSGPALADNHVPIRAISDIKVTNTNQIHFELRNGETVVGDLPDCDIQSFVDAVDHTDHLGLYANSSRSVREGTRIIFLDLKEKRLRKRSLGHCEVSFS